MSAGRKYASASDLRAMLERQGGVCAAPGCMSEGPFEADHSTPNAFVPGKPDQLLCAPCHKRKTFGLMGDVSKIAKAKRIAGERTQFDKRKAAGGSRIKGAGFKGWRKFDGSIVSK